VPERKMGELGSTPLFRKNWRGKHWCFAGMSRPLWLRPCSQVHFLHLSHFTSGCCVPFKRTVINRIYSYNSHHVAVECTMFKGCLHKFVNGPKIGTNELCVMKIGKQNNGTEYWGQAMTA